MKLDLKQMYVTVHAPGHLYLIKAHIFYTHYTERNGNIFTWTDNPLIWIHAHTKYQR